MNSERLFKIVLSELTAELLSLEEDLEIVINSVYNTTVKTKEIKKILGEITITEAKINKFNVMINNANDNNNN